MRGRLDIDGNGLRSQFAGIGAVLPTQTRATGAPSRNSALSPTSLVDPFDLPTGTLQVNNTMTDYAQAILPLQAHDNRSAFLEHAWNIGRGYRNQATELISICQFLSRLALPEFLHEDAELRK